MTDEEISKLFATGYATKELNPILRAHLYECAKESFLEGLKKGCRITGGKIMFDDAFDALWLIVIGFFITVPFTIWKWVEIIIWIIKHVHFSVN